MWHSFKASLVDLLGMSTDSLHVLFGVLIFVLAAGLLRRNPKALVLAWLVLLLIQTVNELLDYDDWYHRTKQWNWRESLKDYATTMVLPSLVLLLDWLRRMRKRAAKSRENA